MEKEIQIYKSCEKGPGEIIPEYPNISYKDARKKFCEYWTLKTFNPELQFCEMHEDSFGFTSTKNEPYDLLYFDENWNTRKMMPSEYVLEFDKPTSWNISNEEFLNNFAIPAICAVMLKLMELGIHFTVWYAEGMKCPHIRIYDLMPRNLEKPVRYKVRKLFTEKIVPLEYSYLIDKALFSEHKVCLEFSCHWKYGKMFKLIQEVMP